MVCKKEKLTLQLLHRCYRKCCTVVTENAARLLPKVLHSCLPKMLYSQFPFTPGPVEEPGAGSPFHRLRVVQVRFNHGTGR